MKIRAILVAILVASTSILCAQTFIGKSPVAVVTPAPSGPCSPGIGYALMVDAQTGGVYTCSNATGQYVWTLLTIGGGGGSGISSITWQLPALETAVPNPLTSNGTQIFQPATGLTPHEVLGTCGTATSVSLCALTSGDIPTLNQNTTGQAGSVANSLLLSNGGTGSISGTNYNGSAGVTISYNSVGASPVNGSTSLNTLGTVTTGTWGATVISPTFGGTGQNESAATGVAQWNSGVYGASTTLANGTSAVTKSNGDNTTAVATDQFVLNNALTNPMTTLGDLPYGGAGGVVTRLAGSTSTSTLCLTETGTGLASAAPSWGSCNAGGAPPSLETNGAPNTTQTVLNIISSSTNAAGLTLTQTNTTGGTVQGEIAGLVNAAHGGTGTSNLSGIRFANSGSTDTAATSSQVITAIGSANIPNSSLTNPAATVNGQTCTLGSTCTVSGGENTQTTNYVLQASDLGKLVVMNCTAACTVTMDASPTNGYYGAIESIGSTIATISLNAKTFNGSASVPVFISYQPIYFWSNGTNYFGSAPLVAGSNMTLTAAANGLTLASAGGTSAAFSAITSGTNTSAAMVISTGSSLSVSGSGTNQSTSTANTGSVSTNATFFPCLLAANTTGQESCNTSSGFGYNPNTNLLTVNASLAVGSSPPTGAVGSATGIWAANEAATAGTPTTGVDYIRANSNTHSFECSLNGGSESACDPLIPNSASTGDIVSWGTWPALNDSGIGTANLLQSTATPAANTACVFTSTSRTCTPEAVPNAALANSSITFNGQSTSLGASNFGNWILGTPAALDLAQFTNSTSGEITDTGIVTANVTQTSSTPSANTACVFASTAKTCTPETVPNAALTNSSVGVNGDGTVLVSPGPTISLGSSGALTLVNAGAGTVLGNATSSSTAPTYHTLTAINPQTATYQVLATDFSAYKTITVASGTFTITLVASGSQPAAGQFINIINYGSGTVTVARSGQNINGGTSSLVLSASSATAPTEVRVISDGTNYFASQAGSGSSSGVTSLSGDGTIITNSASTGAVTLSIAGTSGGIPYFSSGSAWHSSAALTDFGVVYGGGAGAAPAATAVGSTGQVLSSNGGGSAPSWIDIPEVLEVATAGCDGHTGSATAGTSISLPTSATPTPVCRAGTNNLVGYLQFAASESAQFQVRLPLDWDTSTNPYISINYTQSGATASQTIAYQIQVGCSTTTDDPSFAAAQAFATTTTGSTANTPYIPTGLQLNSTSMTNCGAGQVMNFKISTTGSSNGSSNLQLITLTIPRKIVTQAN